MVLELVSAGLIWVHSAPFFELHLFHGHQIVLELVSAGPSRQENAPETPKLEFTCKFPDRGQPGSGLQLARAISAERRPRIVVQIVGANYRLCFGVCLACQLETPRTKNQPCRHSKSKARSIRLVPNLSILAVQNP